MVIAKRLSNNSHTGNNQAQLRVTSIKLNMCILAVFMVVGLSACGDEPTQELREYIADVKSRQKSRIPPLPKPQEFRIFAYDDSIIRNPFEPTIEVQAQE